MIVSVLIVSVRTLPGTDGTLDVIVDPSLHPPEGALSNNFFTIKPDLSLWDLGPDGCRCRTLNSNRAYVWKATSPVFPPIPPKWRP